MQRVTLAPQGPRGVARCGTREVSRVDTFARVLYADAAETFGGVLDSLGLAPDRLSEELEDIVSLEKILYAMSAALESDRTIPLFWQPVGDEP